MLFIVMLLGFDYYERLMMKMEDCDDDDDVLVIV